MLPSVVSVLPNLPLSVLDLAPIPEGATAGDALRATIDLARRAEQLGYHRFWVAEHHNMPGIASSAPCAHRDLAGATSGIRVGSGGVMLPNHVSLVVAEQFGMLEALTPAHRPGHAGGGGRGGGGGRRVRVLSGEGGRAGVRVVRWGRAPVGWGGGGGGVVVGVGGGAAGRGGWGGGVV